jgi:sec-independent protein translocase protein TatB
MFDIGWSEILVIVVVAIVVVGPKDLPPMLRAAGRMMSKLRKTAGEFQSQFNEALREAELDGVKESLDELRNLNPMGQIKKSLDPIQAALSSPLPIAKPAPPPEMPAVGEPAQPVALADVEPAAPPPAAPKPKRTAPRKPKAAAAAPAGEGDGPADVKPPPKPRKAAPSMTPATAAPKANGEAASVAAKKPRAPRPKAPPAAVAELPAAPSADERGS